jgi:hypothetical protein
MITTTVKITEGKSVQISDGLKQFSLAVVDEKSELKRQKNLLENKTNIISRNWIHGKLDVKLFPRSV